MTTLASLAERCPGMTPARLEQVTGFITEQIDIDKKLFPGTVTFLTWVVVSALYWGGVGWWIHDKYKSKSSSPSPSPSPGSTDNTSDVDNERNRSICIAMIVYFSLMILLILFYALLISKFRKAGWDELHPGQTFSGSNPSLTWGLMGLFSMGGLFISIILLCHYTGNDLHPSIIVLLVLLALLLSVTIAMTGKIFVSCLKPSVKMTADEQKCVTEFLVNQERLFRQQQQAIAEAGQRASRVLESRSNINLQTTDPGSLQTLSREASTGATMGLGPVSTLSREAAAAKSAESTRLAREAAAAAQSRNAAAWVTLIGTPPVTSGT